MNLREIQKKSNKTRETVANEIGIKKSNYDNYLNGRNEPNATVLIKLADYFHVTVDELLGHEVPYTLNRVQFSDKQLDLIEQIKSLNDSQCLRVSDFISGVIEAQKVKDNVLKKFEN